MYKWTNPGHHLLFDSCGRVTDVPVVARRCSLSTEKYYVLYEGYYCKTPLSAFHSPRHIVLLRYTTLPILELFSRQIAIYPFRSFALACHGKTVKQCMGPKKYEKINYTVLLLSVIWSVKRSYQLGRIAPAVNGLKVFILRTFGECWRHWMQRKGRFTVCWLPFPWLSTMLEIIMMNCKLNSCPDICN